ncbi:MAG: ABC transporter permease [Actinobacteria bacterium 13_1_20CM_3_71_11]|nr:MAG: ABC transporter permease [Actinobacteria bacterium 13_1_20CM_3_71_11]
MNYLQQAIEWLNDPLNWTNPGGIEDRLVEHLRISAAAVLLGCLIAWPLGLWLGHIGRGGGLVVLISNVTLAVPTVALLTLIPLTVIGFGEPAIILALTVFAFPPLLANAYTGLREVDRQVLDAARGMGLSGWQMLWRATLAALVAGGGLGQIISEGFGLSLAVGGGQVVAGGLLVATLALLVEGTFGIVERIVTPRALRRRDRGLRKAGATAANV